MIPGLKAMRIQPFGLCRIAEYWFKSTIIDKVEYGIGVKGCWPS